MFKDYFQDLFRNSCSFNWYELEFIDENVEHLYKISKQDEERKNSKKFAMIVVFVYIISILYSFILNEMNLTRTQFIYFGGLIIELTLFIICSKFLRNSYIFLRLKMLRFIIVYLVYLSVLNFPEFAYKLENYLRLMYILFIYLNMIYISFMHFNFIILVIMPITNLLSIVWIVMKAYKDSPLIFLTEFFGNFIFQFLIYIIKKNEVTSSKNMFYKNYVYENQIKLHTNLVDVLNTIVISLKKDEVMFLNKYGMDFFKNYLKEYKNPNCTVLENKEIDVFIKDDLLDKSTLNRLVQKLFNSVYLDEELHSNKFFQQGTISLSHIIMDIIKSKVNRLENFFKIGVFSSNDENYCKEAIFEVYIRKLNIEDEIFEVLL
jgi:hypothetical protein